MRLSSFFIFIYLVVSPLGAHCTATGSNDVPIDEYLADQLCARVIEAIEQKDLDKFISINFLEGTDDIEKENLKRFFLKLITDVNNIRVSTMPLNNDYVAIHYGNGAKYVKNMPVIGYIVIDGTPMSGGYTQHKLVFGETGGYYYLANTIKEPLDPQIVAMNKIMSIELELDTPRKTNSNNIVGCNETIFMKLDSNQDKDNFDGYCEVNSYGIVSKIELRGNFSGIYRTLEGQNFLYCKVVNLSKQGKIKLTLRKEGITIFEKDDVDTIIYDPDSTNGGR